MNDVNQSAVINAKSMQLAAKKQAKQSKKDAKEAARLRKHGPKASTSFAQNIAPIFAGISVMLIILLLLNAQWIEAQYKYRFSKPATSATISSDSTPGDANSSAPAIDTKSPHPELGPQLTIPAINVQAPVKTGQGTAEWQIQIALRSGVVNYDNSAKPGQTGNVVIFGHSSGQVWAPGDYKFIFTLLNKVAVNDAVYVDYNGTRYTYKVTGTEVVNPSDVKVLDQGTGHNLTLITCTPVGTSKSRLIVHAAQISPAPTKDTTSNSRAATSINELPGSAH